MIERNEEVTEAAVETEDEDGEEADLSSLDVFEYTVTYQNGIMRRVYDSLPPHEVLHRWQTQLGRAGKSSTLMFPSNQEIELTIMDDQGNEVVCPTVLVRADLILDIAEVIHASDEGEDGSEGEGEEAQPDDPGGAELDRLVQLEESPNGSARRRHGGTVMVPGLA